MPKEHLEEEKNKGKQTVANDDMSNQPKQEDLRPETAEQLKLQAAISSSPQVQELQDVQKMADTATSKPSLWGKMRDKVVGSKGRVEEQVTEAGISDDMRQQSIEQTLVKRLEGDDWNQTKQWVQKKDEMGNPVFDKEGKKVMVAGDSDSKHQIKTVEKLDEKGNPVLDWKGNKVMVDPNHQSKYKYDSAEDAFGEDKVKEHLKKFPKAHAFISEWAFNMIKSGGFKGWGNGSNFVTSLSTGDSLFNETKENGGIPYLEGKLGVEVGKWSVLNGKPTNTMYRFKVIDPAKMNIRMPTGTESGAFQNEWVFGGKTLGKTMEAVVDALTLQELKDSVANGSIEIWEVKFDGESTVENKLSSL